MCISTTNAEIFGQSEATREADYLRYLLEEMQLPILEPIQLWCDSKPVIDIVSKPGAFKATKHIEIRGLYARQGVEEKRIRIDYCPTNDMTADILTKALPLEKFEKFRDALGVKPVLQEW